MSHGVRARLTVCHPVELNGEKKKGDFEKVSSGNRTDKKVSCEHVTDVKGAGDGLECTYGRNGECWDQRRMKRRAH